MKSIHEYISTNNISKYLCEHGICVGGAEIITNQVDDETVYKKVKEICGDTQTHYVSEYKDSRKLIQVLRDNELLGQQHGTGGTLYDSDGKGVLVYWLKFKDCALLCRFLVTFDKYAEKYTYDKVHDGKWHMSFDIHDDPLIGVEDHSVTYYLIYKSKTENLSEIDDAINTMCDMVNDFWNK